VPRLHYPGGVPRLLLVVSLFAACHRAPSQHAPILLYAGKGASSGDVDAFESLLRENHFDFDLTSRLDEEQLRGRRLLIVPGGNFITMSEGLSRTNATQIRDAVHAGMSYLGICAGAFLAADSSFYNSLKLTPGVRFSFYADESRGIRKQAVAIRSGGTTLEQYWEDGPQLSGWGSVVGSYPDGTPAIVEGTSGNGWVLLSGVHPEATEGWRRGLTFQTPVEADRAYAAKLVRAALERTALSHP
jgi:glutamine amidotransferase-like uncharacterized protein